MNVFEKIRKAKSLEELKKIQDSLTSTEPEVMDAICKKMDELEIS